MEKNINNTSLFTFKECCACNSWVLIQCIETSRFLVNNSQRAYVVRWCDFFPLQLMCCWIVCGLKYETEFIVEKCCGKSVESNSSCWKSHHVPSAGFSSLSLLSSLRELISSYFFITIAESTVSLFSFTLTYPPAQNKNESVTETWPCQDHTLTSPAVISTLLTCDTNTQRASSIVKG